jgi:hypothetical protein
MRTKSYIVEERTTMHDKYLFITCGKVKQAFKKNGDEWIRVELKSALLDIGVPGTRADHTHTLARGLIHN